MTIKNQAAIVGVGSTPYYRRGQSWPQTMVEMACKATLTALEDAGLTVDDLDGFAYYSGGFDTALIAQILGVPEVKDFLAPSGLAGPGQMSGLLAGRHMYQYGTKREHFAEVVISTRENAVRRPTSIMQKPLTLDEYFNARMIADPRMPPTPFCWNCRHQEVEWVELPGRGTIFAFIVTRQALIPQLVDAIPYTVAVVELEGAPGCRETLVSNFLQADPNELEIGMPVKVAWDDVTETVTVPRFVADRA